MKPFNTNTRLKNMKIEIRKKLYEVVYIEYQDKIPHAVIVSDNGHCINFDFYCIGGDKQNLYYYESGSGGKITDLYAPKYVEGTTGVCYWMHPLLSFKDKPQPFFTRLKHPLRVKGYYNNSSVNPFKISEETTCHIIYCEKCEQWHIDECKEHQYWDDKSQMVKYNDGSPAE